MADHLTEFQMNQYFGWIQGSKMPSTYVHMSGKNLDDAILTLNGFKKEESKEPERLKPKMCVKCDTINSHDSHHCGKCGSVLDLRTALEQDERRKEEQLLRGNADKLMDMLLKDDQVKSLVLEKLGGLGTNHF